MYQLRDNSPFRLLLTFMQIRGIMGNHSVILPLDLTVFETVNFHLKKLSSLFHVIGASVIWK